MAGDRHALVIATSKYKDARLRRLAAPLNDAKAFAAVLKDPSIGDFAVTAVLDKDASVVEEQIEGFCADRRVEDTIVIYFSGHGVTDDGGNLYLAARNTTRERLRSTGISDGFLRDVLRTCRAQRQVLVLDCCFGGAITKAMLTKGEAGQVDIESTFGGVGSGRVIITASNARQFAFEEDGEDEDVRRSVFTRIIVDGIRSGEADLDQDQQISIDDLYKFAYRRIAIPGSNQTPTITNIGLEGTIVLARTKVRAVATPAPAITSEGAPRGRDLRPFTRVHDSGQEGAAAAIAAVTAMETYLAVHAKRRALSARYIYQKAKELAGTPEDQDPGIMFEELVRVIEDFGTVPESTWPYVAGKTARPRGKTMEALDTVARAYRAQLSAVRSLADIGAALDDGQPVLAGFTVFESAWMSSAVAAGDVIKPPKKGEIPMGSTLVPIVDLDLSAGVMRFANSWGVGWGDRGFGAMTLDAARAMLVLDQMWAVKVRTPPTTGSFRWTIGEGIATATVVTAAIAEPIAEPAAPPVMPVAEPVDEPAKRAPSRRRARPGDLQRFIYDGRVLGASYATLTGKALRREEGGRATKDAAVDRVYSAIGSFHGFLADAFDRRSWDGEGAPYRAVVHYGEAFANGFWDGGAKMVVLGDGDGAVFQGFYGSDVVAKEFANGLVQVETTLANAGQSGSLLNALSLVIASMAKQHAARQTSAEADWLIGTELFAPKVNARALFSLLDPGSAYDDPMVGKDLTVGHFDDYVTTKDDNGGVHVNACIPARAFALSARALGGRSWERAGLVWYRTISSHTLKPTTTFRDFAGATLAVARRDFDGDVAGAVEDSWRQVGVIPTTK